MMVGASVVLGKILETIQIFQVKRVCVMNRSIINHVLVKKVHSLDQRKQAKLHWFEDLSQSGRDELSCLK